MARQLTNATPLQYAIEASLATLPGAPTWFLVERNSIGSWGSEITTTPRDPVSTNRQRRKGSTTDLDSTVEFETDMVLSHMIDFIEGFAFVTATGVGTQATSVYEPTAVVDGGVGTDSYTVAADGDLLINELIFARGFTNSDNNGLKVLATGSIATQIEVPTGSLVAEPAPPSNAEVAVCGFQGATGDLEIDVNGDLISTVLDFTTLGLTVGQVLYVGGATAGLKFAVAANVGYARIVTIAANLVTLDKKVTTFAIDNGAGQTVQIFYGRFIRNVATDHASFLERSFQFELFYDDLTLAAADAYEYAKGNYCNELAFNLPLTDKGTINFGFIGTDTPAPTTSRATNASAGVNPNRTSLFNTSADVVRLRLTDTDETGLSTYFKSMTMTLRNNVAPEKVLGTLGAAFMNYGNFEVDIDAVLLFTLDTVATRVRANTTVTMDFVLKNDDGAIFVDIPSLTIGDGSKDFPVNESVTINLTGMAFQDATLDTSIGISLFPHIPAT